MESGLEGQMSTHRHEEDESLMEMGSGRFGYFFNLVYFFCLAKSFLILLSQNCFVIYLFIFFQVFALQKEMQDQSSLLR